MIDLEAVAEAFVRRKPISDFDRLLFAVTNLLLSVTALCSGAFFTLKMAGAESGMVFTRARSPAGDLI